jgi:hypothetical protein
VTFEFPHLLRLVEQRQFDTIYHEHFSYLSLHVVQSVLRGAGMRVFDVEELNTHGGSLRVYACHQGATHRESAGPAAVLSAERAGGLLSPETYEDFRKGVVDIKCDVLDFFVRARREGKSVAGYGAAAKGNTFLNYCGIGPEFLPVVADRSNYKQGHYLPGTLIPVVSPEEMMARKPDYILILPWNLRREIESDLGEARSWGAKFVVAIPQLSIF